MPSDLKEKFQKIETLTWEALMEHRMNKQHDLIPKERGAQDRFIKEGELLVKEIENAVQQRLWSSITGEHRPAND